MSSPDSPAPADSNDMPNSSEEFDQPSQLTKEQRRAFRKDRARERQAAKEQAHARKLEEQAAKVENRAHRDFARTRMAARLAGNWLVSGPVSVVLALLLIAMFVVSLAVGRAELGPVITSGLDHPWWTIFSSLIWTTDLLHVLVDVSLLLTVGIALERSAKSLWYLGIGLVSYWSGAVSSVALAVWIDSFDPAWGDVLEAQDVSGTSVFLVGVAMAAAIKLGTIWRRRILVTVGTVLLVMLGFAGTLDTVAAVVAGIVGVVIGLVIWGRSMDRTKVQGTPREGRVTVSLIVAGVVTGVLISLSSPEFVGALSSLRYGFISVDLSPEEIAQLCDIEQLQGQCAHYTYLMESSGWGSRILMVVPLLLQLALAWGLRGGRRAALWGTIILQGVTALIGIVHLVTIWMLVKGEDSLGPLLGLGENGEPTARFIVPIVVPLLLILVIVLTSRLFTVRSAPGTYARFWRVLIWCTAVTLLIAVILGVIFRGSLGWLQAATLMVPDFLIRVLPSSMLSLVSPQTVLASHGMLVILEWAPIVPWIAAIALLLRALSSRYLPNAISRDQYIDVVKSTDAGTMGWITTWEGNRYWGSQKYDAAIAYRAHGGVALTVSDPAARPADLPGVVKEFTEYCVEQGLTPAFYSVHAPVASVTDQWGWPRLQVAEETILQLPDLAFKGKPFQDVRTALNRGTKEGIRPVWTTWVECPHALRDQIQQISDQWVSDKSLPEMGFTLGGVAELDDPEVRILLAVDEGDVVQGVTSWMPVYEEEEVIGWTLDFMRRREGGFRPVIEYLIAQAALWAQSEQYEVLSLSGAPLAKAQGSAADQEMEGSSLAMLDGVLDLLGRTLEPLYGFRSLLRFKAKFQPQYAPVYLTVPDVSALASVGLAISHAYLPTLSVVDALHVAQTVVKK